ncbi:TPA: restriction endonuclease subunit S, partial [Serratia marcescens]
DKQLSELDDLDHSVQKLVELLKERRTTLISAAVTGKIDVRDWVAPDMQDAEEPQETTA